MYGLENFGTTFYYIQMENLLSVVQTSLTVSLRDSQCCMQHINGCRFYYVNRSVVYAVLCWLHFYYTTEGQPLLSVFAGKYNCAYKRKYFICFSLSLFRRFSDVLGIHVVTFLNLKLLIEMSKKIPPSIVLHA